MSMKAALYFAAGVVVGSAATYFAVRGFFEKKAEERIVQETDSVRKAYQKMSVAKEMADRNRQEKQERMEERIVPEEKAQKHDIQKSRTDRSKAPTAYRRNIFENWPDDEDTIFEAPSEGAKEEPYVIDANQFANEKKYFDKITIFIYQDDVAVDSEDQVVDDVNRLIGMDIYNQLGELCDDDGVVLVRNEMRSADYEIILVDETYIPDTAPVRDG